MSEADKDGVSVATDTAETVAAVAEPPAALSVGQRLRAAREAAGLSVADVARSLKFGVRQVELLEADDYAALPGNTVVRGFTRGYARLLKLDADELVHLLDAQTPVAPADVRPPDNMGEANDARAERKPAPLLSAAIVIALAAALLALWHFFVPESKAPEARKAVAVAPPAPVLPAPGAAPASAGVAPVPAAEPVVAAGGGAVAESAAPVLSFAFEDRSWVEVTDASRQKLHSGENPPGSRLTLTGRPPFDIVIGNATKVTLTYEGRSVDLAPHTRADVARFRLE